MHGPVDCILSYLDKDHKRSKGHNHNRFLKIIPFKIVVQESCDKNKIVAYSVLRTFPSMRFSKIGRGQKLEGLDNNELDLTMNGDRTVKICQQKPKTLQKQKWQFYWLTVYKSLKCMYYWTSVCAKCPAMAEVCTSSLS